MTQPPPVSPAWLCEGLARILPAARIISDSRTIKAYEMDALTLRRAVPAAVVLPDSVGEVAAILRFCSENRVPVVPRGAGTSLSGGALPVEGGIVLGMGKFSHILEIDYDNRCITVQPGVTNAAVTRAVEERGFYYAPDPSSQAACTIGGNIAENSGGIHCLKYGLTTHNLLGIELVTISGEIVRLGGRHAPVGGLDLMGLLVGSEGLLGVVTEATLRILPRPESICAILVGLGNVRDGGKFVASVIAAGIIPSGMEMMDQATVNAIEDYRSFGYPRDAGAVVICEVDGAPAEVASAAERIREHARKCGVTHLRTSGSGAEVLKLWAGRKAAFSAAGLLAPDMLCMDGTIPRHQLPRVLEEILAIGKKYGLPILNVFHAGDGNLHPLILYDAGHEDEAGRAEACGADILRLCVAAGGVLSGEHGIGVEKKDLMGEMFSPVDLAHQERVKCALDPEQLLNPGKVFPQLHRCAELGKLRVHRGNFPHPGLPRF